MKPLTKQEDAEFSEWLLDNPNARLQFIGWILLCAKFSPKIAREIRDFKTAYNRRKNEN